MSNLPEDQRGDDRLSEEDAHRILARAVELDDRDRADVVSIAQLQSIAAEAGIAAGALEGALREFRAGALPMSGGMTVARPGLPARLRGLRCYAALAAFVAGAATTPGDFVVGTALAALPFYALYELSLYLLRDRGRNGPSSPVAPHRAPNVSTASTRTESVARDARYLLLRPRIHASAV